VDVCVVGPGALGCLHAALLARAGVPTSLLDYRPDRAGLIRERGIVVEDGETTWTQPVLCSAIPDDLPIPSLLILCVKTFQTPQAARHATGLVGPQTIVLRLQNGLASPDCLLEVAPEDRILLGTSGHGANMVAWGHVRRAGHGPTRIGALVPDGRPAADAASEVLRPALQDVKVSDDLPTILWSKLVLNAAINPLTAITGLRNGQVLEVPLLRAALRDVARETEDVGVARGARLEAGEGAQAAERACRLTAENRSSMLQDVSAGRRTEIDDICGAVVREAEAAGRSATLNRALTWLVREVAGQPATKRRGPESA
jgi:2-dehydropantoate 2-reductase